VARSELRRLVAQAPVALCRQLEGVDGELEAPIRSELFGLQRFAQHGVSLALTHRVTARGRARTSFFPRLQGNIVRLRSAFEYISVQANAGYDISPAAEWLVENFHLLEAQFKEVSEGLPPSYFRSLPVLTGAPLAGLPRVYAIAWAFVAHTDGAFDDALLVHFLQSYQTQCELKLSELWALPSTLRVVLMENLRRLAERVAANKAARELANLCCDQLADYDLDTLDDLHQLLRLRGVGTTFMAQLMQRLLESHADIRTPYLDWAHAQLPDFAAVQAQQRADQVADNLSVSNAITALRAIGDADWGDIVLHSSPLMTLLLTCPVFAAEHALTRDGSLHAIERLAKRSGLTETDVARTMLRLMAQCDDGNVQQTVPGYWLLGVGRSALSQALGSPQTRSIAARDYLARKVAALYPLAILLLTFTLVAWLLWSVAPLPSGVTPLLALLLPFPVSEAVLALINRLVSESSRPRHLQRLAFSEGIPDAHRVLVVIPCMLGSEGGIRQLCHRLRLHYLANLEEQAQFALLSDWLDAPEHHAIKDAELLAIAQARIEDLNRLHPWVGAEAANRPARFVLMHRERTYSASERAWIGWERKRGKLELLIAALATGNCAAFLDLGPTSALDPRARYVVTLDSDTQLPPGRLRDLVGVAAHPFNQPQLDARGLRVVSGYGILQPRIVCPLPGAHALTRFHWLFAGQFGIDPYGAVSSEIYQDLFGQGSFTGKGLLHVNAMHAVLSHRLPDDQVLSHDLLEGALARCGSVTDITLMEDAPFHADVAASRSHRWTRGDWQLLPFLLHARRYGINALNVWKMLDNLRRSLVAPASLLLLVATLLVPTLAPWLVLLVVVVAYTSGSLIGAFAGFVPSHGQIARWHFFRGALADLARALGAGLWHLALLLQASMLSVDAIARALYRMLFSRRHLLQWTTAAAAEASARFGLQALVLQHWGAPLGAVLLGALLLVLGHAPLQTVSLCLLWGGAPLWIWFVSHVISPPSSQALTAPMQDDLHLLARQTWRYFERTVTADNHFLPPDNLQVVPQDLLAQRTSPTNIGLYLLSVACAREFGWIATVDLLQRLEASYQTLQGLQRDHGHFLNWYDTRTCEALRPMYVSTVDSGNLCSHLLCVAQACRLLAAAPDDTLSLKGALEQSKRRLAPLLRERNRLNDAARTGLRWLLDDHRALLRSMRLGLANTSAASQPQVVARLLAVAGQFETLAWQPDFAFLYHRKRHLLHIGYRPEEQQLDAGFYDLLASEARLTSLVAISKGDVPVAHWAALGRMFCVLQQKAGLRSWSGSMFEYLMPGLVIEEPVGSVLADACAMAVGEQMAFAARQQVPWGISEAAYAAQDQTLAYQYAPQGVPRLALRRTPAEELVVAPYASILALQLEPFKAWTNLNALQALGARQRYGFIEALDYSPARQATPGAFTLVATFMAHHQGMSLAALANVLCHGVVQRWAMANPHLQAISSLLHERTPREISRLYTLPSSMPPQMLRKRAPGLLRTVTPGATALEPTHVLSNGRYSVALRSNGAGWSRWGRHGLSRWRDDLLRDAYGHFFYLREPEAKPGSAPALVSITRHPAADPQARYQSTFHADRVCFHTEWSALATHMTVWVSPEDDIEFRQIELRNRGNQNIEIELFSSFEPTLAMASADAAHPAFSGMFVRAQWHAAYQALLLERLPRLEADEPVHAAHFLAQSDHVVLGLRVCAARAQWLGRGRDAANPLADLQEPPAGNSPIDLHTGLDPACVLAVRILIAPHGNAKLTFATSAAARSDTLMAVVDKYRQGVNIQRASLMSATLAGIRLRALKIGADPFAVLQSLCTALLWSVPRPQSPDSALLRSPSPVCDRRYLWRQGISGDLPILLVSVGVVQGVNLLRALAQAMRLWAWGGVACDLVVLNFEPNSYNMALQREINAIRERLLADSANMAAPSALYLLRGEELSADEVSTLRGLARLHIHADGRPLLHHLQEWIALHEDQQQVRLEVSRWPVPRSLFTLTRRDCKGSFDVQTGAYNFAVAPGEAPPRPWSNVLANPNFGTVLTESGGGFSWALNSRLHQLTAWSNDPVSDPAGEIFLLQDARDHQAWSLTPNTWRDPEASYQISHGQGISSIAHQRGGLDVCVTWSVDSAQAFKSVHIRIANAVGRNRRMRLIGLVEWIMGAQRVDRSTCTTRLYAPAQDPDQSISLLCTQRASDAGFGDSTASFSLTRLQPGLTEDLQWTCDRREFFDSEGQLVLPQHLAQRSGEGLDPCAAIACDFLLGGEAQVEFVFTLGHGSSVGAACALLAQQPGAQALQSQQRTRAYWDALLGSCVVHTPDPLLDLLTNRWFLYQAVSCRLWAKAGFYQAGGATGFRDQLQDTLALAWSAPSLLREQIVLCASRQFAAGDVQHWWHAPTGAGVRTHFSDDLLWLPYALAHYLKATGDSTVLEQSVQFLEGPEIAEGAEDAYFTPSFSASGATVWEHAARTVDASLRVGVHRLPLMGGGDWNDGMNAVGKGGSGESVWLGWFLCRVIAAMAPLARQRQEVVRAQHWETAAALCQQALLETAWDGQWFCRAFFDEGQPLGASANVECRIDLIAQAWSVLSAVAPLQQQALAMDSAHNWLVDETAGLVKLLTPPMQHSRPSAGYIQAYPPGVRENGGQYCHAAVWALMAQAELHRSGLEQTANGVARADLAYRYFTYLSPAHRSADSRQCALYGLEPYAMAGDVYGEAPYQGVGGWSWYTGSASLMHRAVLESFFGLQQQARTLSFTPCLPTHWSQAELTLRRDGHSLHFVLQRLAQGAVAQAAREQEALVLAVGEELHWQSLRGDARYLIPLPRVEVQDSPENEIVS
jgi:cyclic beta-1,2-glucan synthetase